ncbi:glycosyltransferase family 4 protein [Vreelandella zhaodongensis]|uniref:Glycosyltransferase family 4 protein n=1 Tax=Vreelandella zhaodongensis TaxID=1176240 RepID=A0ABX2SP93_VREZH|nr:glycosyltransferase family 4 protein [Halomonas zhaodongensis]NYS43407.1 glycosyltransferase family 4 protein [Halomonas zhaodongensis]
MTAWQAVRSLTWAQHKKGWRQHGWRYPFLCWAVARLFNEQWYLQHYPDVAAGGGNAFAHCLLYGLVEGRELSPRISISGYGVRYIGNQAWESSQAVIHYWWWGRWRGLSPLPCFAGRGVQAASKGQLCLAVFAHSVSPRLYGAERSLLDALRTLEALGVATVVVVPNASNPSYLDALRQISRSVCVMPYGWWREGEADHPDTLAAMQSLLEAAGVNGVYMNTLTLQAPSVVAKRLGLPVLTHVRELPAHDPGLCDALNSSAEGVVAHAVAHSDLLIVNSQCTAGAFEQPGVPVRVVPNMIELSVWKTVPECQPDMHRPLRVGLLGSLIYKKGLEDFVALADVLARKGVAVECCLYGANTPELDALLDQQRDVDKASGNKSNVFHKGYVHDPKEALANLDVVVNLSRFQESFGRTVLEAMAAARPVVAYEWGALPELVAHGKTGFLAPLGDVHRVAQWIEVLAHDPALLASMGRAGRQHANDLFGAKAHQAAMAQALRALFINGAVSRP